ncbi:MAG TPA: DUF1786 family protein [Tepidiformaceae bacterium]
MRILAIDMGTGTQDILLFDSDKPVENCVKMVMPSATEIAARRIRRAAREARPLVLTGVVAGGGPSSWALEEFIAGGGRAYATTEAAQTFNDDLEEVRASGVEVISDDEAAGIDGERVVLQDLDMEAIAAALRAFEEPLALDGLALGCLDHGAAPPDVSDRLFRFEHLRRVVEGRNDLLAFAFAPEALPDYLTRARAMVRSAGEVAPVVFMDTGPAAALGALHDEAVGRHEEQVVLNLGNMHLLGFHLRGRRVASLYEHHTGEARADQIVTFTERMAEGTLEHGEIFHSKGHGAYHHDRGLVHDRLPEMVAVTGPQRPKIAGSALNPYFAAPFGDMMISGCFGLLRGFGDVHPRAGEAVASRLGPLP